MNNVEVHDSGVIQVEIQLFAAAADIAGCRKLQVSVPVGASLAEVRQRLTDQNRDLFALAGASRWAVGTEFVSDDYTFEFSQNAAMIPPVSGG